MPQPPITIKASLFEEGQAAANAVHHRRMAELENMRQMLALLDEMRPEMAAAGFVLQADELSYSYSGKALHWYDRSSTKGRPQQVVELLTNALGFEVVEKDTYKPATHFSLRKGLLTISIVCYDNEAEGLQA